MNYYSVFYWLTVADGVKKFFNTASNIFTCLTVVLFIAYVIIYIVMVVAQEDVVQKKEDSNAFMSLMKKLTTRLFYPMLIAALITWTGFVFTPSKKDCLLIVAGGSVGNFLTHDSSAKKIPDDIANFLHVSLQEQIKNVKEDVKEDIKKQTETPKDQYLDKLKSMTKDQIISYLKDSAQNSQNK